MICEELGHRYTKLFHFLHLILFSRKRQSLKSTEMIVSFEMRRAVSLGAADSCKKGSCVTAFYFLAFSPKIKEFFC